MMNKSYFFSLLLLSIGLSLYASSEEDLNIQATEKTCMDTQMHIDQEGESPQAPIPGTNLFLDDVELINYANLSPNHQKLVNEYNHGLFLTLVLAHLLNGAAKRAYNFNESNSQSFTSHISTILELTQIITQRWGFQEFITNLTKDWKPEGLSFDNLYQFINDMGSYLATHLQNSYDDLRSINYISSVFSFINMPFLRNLPALLPDAIQDKKTNAQKQGICRQTGTFLNQLAHYSQNILTELPLNQKYFIGIGRDECLSLCLEHLQKEPSEDLQAVHDYIEIVRNRIIAAHETCRKMQIYHAEEDRNDDQDNNVGSFKWLTNCLPQLYR